MKESNKPRPPKRFRPDPFPYHHELELEIESLTNMGQGVARVDGWVVFVRFALPGDKVRARIYRNDKNFSEADLIEVLESSADRVEPKCQLFGRCGGCQYQNLSYSKQLEWKQRQVAELIDRALDGDYKVEAPIPSPVEYGYRSKITPHFQKPRKGEDLPIGFLEAARRRIVDVPQCPIAMPAINEEPVRERERVIRDAGSFKKGATLLLRAGCDGSVETNPNEIIEENVGGVKFKFIAGGFFQNNPFILEQFAGHVAAEASATGAPKLVDAYCGSGFFCLTSAGHFDEAVGIEISEIAADWAAQNARANGIENARFIAGSAEAIFEEIEFAGTDCAVVIDPPRKGCNDLFLNQLFKFGARRVVYVSCNPATQLRDLEKFLSAGYSINKIQPFDLFPQTRHLECVVTLDKS